MVTQEPPAYFTHISRAISLYHHQDGKEIEDVDFKKIVCSQEVPIRSFLKFTPHANAPIINSSQIFQRQLTQQDSQTQIHVEETNPTTLHLAASTSILINSPIQFRIPEGSHSGTYLYNWDQPVHYMNMVNECAKKTFCNKLNLKKNVGQSENEI